MDSQAVKEFFESVAGQWDEMRTSFYNAAVIDALTDRAQMQLTDTVADIGCGTGFVASGMASRVERVLGVDNSPAMLAAAESNLASLGIDNVTLLAGEIDHLPLETDSVDAAVANMVLHHAERPAAMLAEMARVVRPGGIVAVTDEMEHHYAWMRTEQADVWLGFTESQVAGFFADARLVEFGYDSLGMQ